MNILVIDDEPLIHISIEKLIHTCAKEHTIFHAYNGHEMLDILSKHDFGLAYVDIKMPGLSGLEAIRQAREISPSTSYYIMTGFDEFEYAKQAVKLKVDDYLMKPLDLKTIQETLNAASLHAQANLEQKKTIFRNWLESTLNRRDSSFGPYTGYSCCLILVNVDSVRIPPETIQEPLSSYEDHIVSFFTEEGLLLLCFSPTPQPLQDMIRKFSSVSYPTGITYTVSSITREPAELKTILQSIGIYACLRTIFGTGRLYYLNPLQNSSVLQLNFSQNLVQLKHLYHTRDYTAFSSQAELVLRLYQKEEELHRYSKAFGSFLSLILDRQESLSDNGETVKEILQQSARELLSSATIDSKIQPVIRFIQEHYRETLSTADLSERFGLSANYINKLLKDTLGIRYNDYVTQLRLNHAKELLVSTHMSVKEITMECGYYSQSHFTRLFLDHTGCTPSEYRKKPPSV